MCGIAGLISKNKVTLAQKESVERMIGNLIHRGPDGQGTFSDRNIEMGMRRLSIIDLSGGWQPLYNEDESLVLIINGEIYNYLELTDFLKGKGHVFGTHSDGETILHLYEEYKQDCVQHLRGMFAFVLYDRKNKIVFIARDRMGEKPLYLYENGDSLLFSSEMKSLIASGIVPFELDPVAVNEYFHYQYVPEPKSPLKKVRKLPRAHFMKIEVSDWRIREHKYWEMDEAPPVYGNPPDLIREELDNISTIVIRSDVPVGVALSGGLDSSAIAGLAIRKYPETMKAFSVGYPGRPANDERNDAKELADILRMPFHEIELETSDLIKNFEELNFLRDEPIADISGFGYYSVSKAAREQGVPVLLQGQGADELFWGYPWVRDAAEKTGELCLGKPSHQQSWLNRFKNKVFNRNAWKAVPRKYRPVFYELVPFFNRALSDVKNYYTDSFNTSLGSSSALDVYTFSEPWEYADVIITKLICDTYLLQNGIAQGDRLSMANSVELRLPFVDHKLVELVIGLRKANQDNPDFKYFPKPWLKAAVRGILPDPVIDRPKRGFSPPVWEWHEEIFRVFGNYLSGGFLVQSGVLTKDAGEYLSTGVFPPDSIVPISFKALVMEIWCREMLKLKDS